MKRAVKSRVGLSLIAVVSLVGGLVAIAAPPASAHGTCPIYPYGEKAEASIGFFTSSTNVQLASTYYCDSTHVKMVIKTEFLRCDQADMNPFCNSWTRLSKTLQKDTCYNTSACDDINTLINCPDHHHGIAGETWLYVYNSKGVLAHSDHHHTWDFQETPVYC